MPDSLHAYQLAKRGYRRFDDMRGVLDGMVGFGFLASLGEKMGRESVGDPVEQLRGG